MAWEYRVETYRERSGLLRPFLNDLGNKDWELVAHWGNPEEHQSMILVFKRKKSILPRRQR